MTEEAAAEQEAQTEEKVIPKVAISVAPDFDSGQVLFAAVQNGEIAYGIAMSPQEAVSVSILLASNANQINKRKQSPLVLPPGQ